MIVYFRLYQSYQDAIAGGWENATDAVVREKTRQVGVTRLKNPGRRSQVGGKTVFKRVFSQELINSIATASSLKAASVRKGRQGPKVDIKPEALEKYIAMVVDVCANRLTNWTDYVRDPERKTNLSSNEYETLKAKLNLNYRECFLLLNESFKELIEVSYLLFPTLIGKKLGKFF